MGRRKLVCIVLDILRDILTSLVENPPESTNVDKIMDPKDAVSRIEVGRRPQYREWLYQLFHVGMADSRLKKQIAGAAMQLSVLTGLPR